METMMVQGYRIDYVTEGEGFPLLLMAEPQGTLDLWTPQIPLLGEICRTMAYALCVAPQGTAGNQALTQPQDALPLGVLLDTFHLERVYLASPLRSWPTALQFVRGAPERVEGLLLVAIGSTPASLMPPDYSNFACTYGTHLRQIHIPALVLTGESTAPYYGYADTLAKTLPHCTRLVLPTADLPPHNSASLQLGHAMMRFLIHCERQRHLVHGASLLL